MESLGRGSREVWEESLCLERAGFLEGEGGVLGVWSWFPALQTELTGDGERSVRTYHLWISGPNPR